MKKSGSDKSNRGAEKGDEDDLLGGGAPSPRPHSLSLLT